jgi:hypothetical protein
MNNEGGSSVNSTSCGRGGRNSHGGFGRGGSHDSSAGGGWGALVVASTAVVATLAVVATTPSTSVLRARCARRRVIPLTNAGTGMMKNTFQRIGLLRWLLVIVAGTLILEPWIT